LTRALSDAEISIPASRMDPQRLAWGVLLISFALFGLICVVAGFGINYFLFQSTVPMTTTLQVGRGTVGITNPSDPVEQVAQPSLDLSGANGFTMHTTTSESQATLSFRDPAYENRLIAAITLKGETSLNLQFASRPRFDWSAVRYDIDLRGFNGELDVVVADELDRDLSIGIRTLDGYWILLSNSGQYLLNASNAQIQIINLEGTAVLVPPDAQNPRDIPPGGQAVVQNTGDNPQIALTSTYIDLLESTEFPDLTATQPQDVLNTWQCTNEEDNPPSGEFRQEVIDGRLSLRLIRGGAATTHGDTRCLKWFSQGGESVAEYDYLSLRATFRVNYQSLNLCGDVGSECPLMFRIDYIDTDDRAQRWYYGFFYSLDPLQGDPFRCNSVTCTQDYPQVNVNSWYNFDSGNLFALFRQNQLPLPSSIINVQFYASGHMYDVHVSDVSLVVGRNTQTGEPIPPA
jgi:hypothetical protein